MRALRSAALLLSAHALSGRGAQAVMVGDAVCITGYIMDRYCIENTGGFLLDNPSIITLQKPEEHSYHCLLDVGLCSDSGFLVLGPKDASTDRHCLGFRIDSADKVLAAGRAAGQRGYCTTCTGGDGDPEYGYQATVRGIVDSLGDGSDGVSGTPVLTEVELLDAGAGCGEPDSVPPLCARQLQPGPGQTPAPTPASTPAATETDSPPDPTPAPVDGATPDPDLAPGAPESCPDTLDMSEEIDDRATLYYAVVPSDPADANSGLFCARLEVENDGWVGLAFSPAGKMEGSIGMIGVDGSVRKYELFSYGVTEMPAEKQTLMDTSITQDGDMTIMSFAKLLVEEGEVPIVEGTNNFLHARGGDSVSYHGGADRFPFVVELGATGEGAPGEGAPGEEIKVGDEVCITNFIMDRFCIDQGFFIDDTDTMTLEHPEEHSFHCLLDVDRCQESGYLVLTDKNKDTGMHCLGYRLEDTNAVLAAGFAAGREGYCTGCTGDESKPEYGWKATVKGTVKELGDGSNGVMGTPILESITILDESEECETTIVNPVCMDPPAPPPTPSSDLDEGSEVCLTGYIMDQYCIGLGHFLDDDEVMTLENPELHSFHCLLDVDLCKDSGYTVLGPKDDETGMHCLGYRLQETERVIEAGLAAGRQGYCTDCTGDESKPEAGYMATIKGTVKALGDGSTGLSGAPVLEDIEVLDASVACETTTLPPQCTGAAPMVPPPAPVAKDCSSQMCEEQLSPDYLLRYRINVPPETTEEVCDQCTIDMELIYEGEAWVAIGFSTDGQMIGSEAVIGTPGGDVQKYILGGKTESAVEPMPESQQTLTATSIEVADEQTVMKFTKLLKEPGEIEITPGDNTFIWAHGSSADLGYHGIASRASFELNLSSGASEAVAAPNMSAWLAHGIMAFLAWGVFAPFAVQSSLLRTLLPDGLWFQLHRGFNATAFALFIAAFSVAVAYINTEGGIHWNTSHQKMGLAMFCMAALQVLGGAFRPHLPEADSGDEKTPVRKGWEVGHRLMGVALLACGFWQMAEGIKLYSGKYAVSPNDEDAVTIAYWVWIGVMAAIIVLGGGYYKYKAMNASDDEAPPADTAAPGEEEEVP